MVMKCDSITELRGIVNLILIWLPIKNNQKQIRDLFTCNCFFFILFKYMFEYISNDILEMNLKHLYNHVSHQQDYYSHTS